MSEITIKSKKDKICPICYKPMFQGKDFKLGDELHAYYFCKDCKVEKTEPKEEL